MIVRVAKALRPLASTTTVVAQLDDDYHDLGLQTIADRTPGAGPLAGLQSALQHAATQRERTPGSPWVVVTACDWITPDASLIHALATHVSPPHLAACYRADQYLEPFPGLYHFDLISEVQSLLETGPRSMQALLQGCGERLHVVGLPSSVALPLDADHPEDLSRGESREAIESSRRGAS